MFGIFTGSVGAIIMSISTHDAYTFTNSFYNPGLFSFAIFAVAFVAWWIVDPDVNEWKRQREQKLAAEKQMAERAAAEETARAEHRRKLLEDEAALPNANAETYTTSNPIDITDVAKALAKKLR